MLVLLWYFVYHLIVSQSVIATTSVENPIDFSGFKPCRIYLLIKSNLKHEHKNKLFSGTHLWPVQFQVVPKERNVTYFPIRLFRSMKSKRYLIVKAFSNETDNITLKTNDKSPVWATLRVITRIIIYFESNPYGYCYESQVGSPSDQYITFVVHVSGNSQTQWMFCCPLCAAKRLNATAIKRKSYLNMVTQKRHWKHLVPVYKRFDGRRVSAKVNLKWCNKWNGFDPKNCSWSETIGDNVFLASRLVRDWSKTNTSIDNGPVTYISHRLTALGRIAESASLVLEYYKKPSVIYCVYDTKEAMEQGDIWLRQISPTIGSMLLVSCFAFACLKTHSEQGNEDKSKITVRFLVQKTCANLGFTLSMFVRQGWYQHKVPSLLFLQVVSVFLVCLYENSILKDIVVPKADRLFENLTDLMAANYSYVYYQKNKTDVARDTNKWVRDHYDTKRRRRARTIASCCTNKQIKKNFGKRSDGVKAAYNDEQLEKQFLIEKVQLLVGYKYPCHSMSPTEKVFSAKAYFTAYKSPIGDYLAETHRQLQSIGFRVALENWIKFTNELEVEHIRKDVQSNDTEWKVYQEKKDKQLFDNVITLSHWATVLRAAKFALIFAVALLVGENCVHNRQKLRFWLYAAENWANKQLQRILNGE